jgi:hypothetical protein
MIADSGSSSWPPANSPLKRQEEPLDKGFGERSGAQRFIS